MNFEHNKNSTYNKIKPEVYDRIKKEAIIKLQSKLDGIDAALAQKAIDLLESDEYNFIQTATNNWFEAVARSSNIEQTEKDLARGLTDRALGYVKNNIQEAA